MTYQKDLHVHIQGKVCEYMCLHVYMYVNVYLCIVYMCKLNVYKFYHILDCMFTCKYIYICKSGICV